MIQLVTPPQSTQLTTMQAMQDELGVDPDPRLPSLINQASAACVGYCGRPFARATWTESFRGVRSPLMLSRLPVILVASLARNGVEANPSTYALNPETGLLEQQWAECSEIGGADLRGAGQWWPDDGSAFFRDRTVHTLVTYTAGWLLPNDPGRDLPDDVERAAIEMTKSLWFSSGSGARDPGIRSDTTEGIGSTSYRDPVPGQFGLPMMSADMLTPYRRTT